MMTGQTLLKTSVRVMLVAGMSALLMALSVLPASAQGTINVTTTVDEFNDPGPDTGCSLREAVEAIQNGASYGGCDNSSGNADSIQLLAATYTLTRLAAGNYWWNDTGSLYIYDVSVTIRGVGASQTIVEGTASFDDRVFYVYDSSVTVAVKFEGLTIQGGNTTGSGGGIFASMTANGGASTLDLVDVILKDNTAAQNGGGLGQDYGAATTMNRVTVSGNKAQFGGGIYYGARYVHGSPTGTPGVLRMTNVTISDNEAQNSGGGLYLAYQTEWQGEDLDDGPSEAEGTHVTFANNRAIGGSGGNIYNQQSTLRLGSTILSGGTDSGGANNCDGNPVANITSLGYNLDSGTTCGLSGVGDLKNKDPLLDPLAYYGGGIPTHRLQSGSPALDQIPIGTNGCGTTVATDERGVDRPQPAGESCDVGAFELEWVEEVEEFVPEPGTLMLLGSGLAGLAGYATLRWRARQ